MVTLFGLSEGRLKGGLRGLLVLFLILLRYPFRVSKLSRPSGLSVVVTRPGEKFLSLSGMFSWSLLRRLAAKVLAGTAGRVRVGVISTRLVMVSVMVEVWKYYKVRNIFNSHISPL